MLPRWLESGWSGLTRDGRLAPRPVEPSHQPRVTLARFSPTQLLQNKHVAAIDSVHFPFNGSLRFFYHGLGRWGLTSALAVSSLEAPEGRPSVARGDNPGIAASAGNS